ncbi:MAG: hypothetical protein AB1679_26730 [Actinomycetota bacterium]|jgi:hypothetical protein
MGEIALVTGSPTRVEEVSAALEEAGFKVLRVPEPGDVAAACSGIEAGSLACYVQLPKETKVDAPSLIGRVRQFLAEGLLARFEQASTVVPCLARDACVVLVAGNLPGAATPDDRHARIDLLRVLARAVLAECEGNDVRAVVVANDRSPADIADIARRRGDQTGKKAAEVAALGDMNYADWQREFLSLTTEE